MSVQIFLNECIENPDETGLKVAAERFLATMRQDWQAAKLYRRMMELPLHQFKNLLEQMAAENVTDTTTFVCRALLYV